VLPSAARECYPYVFKSDRNATLHRRVEDIIARRRRDDKFATTPTEPAERQPQESEGMEAPEGKGEEARSVTAPHTPLPTSTIIPLATCSSSIPSPIPLPTAHPLHLSPSTKPKPKIRWRDLDQFQKLQASIEATGRRDGQAFSLNLGIGREGALFNSDDPARRLSHEINRALRRSLGHDLPYNFVLELTQDEHGYDRLHVHGSFIPGSERLGDIRDALTRAAGQALSTLGGKRQLATRPIFNAVGWASYVTKARRWGKALPAGRHHFVNRSLSQVARQDHAQFGLDDDIVFTRNRRKKVD
jgi:hypothetical protein